MSGSFTPVTDQLTPTPAQRSIKEPKTKKTLQVSLKMAVILMIIAVLITIVGVLTYQSYTDEPVRNADVVELERREFANPILQEQAPGADGWVYSVELLNEDKSPTGCFVMITMRPGNAGPSWNNIDDVSSVMIREFAKKNDGLMASCFSESQPN